MKADSSQCIEILRLQSRTPTSKILVSCPSLRISAGKIVGILGTNGAGKTSLLKCLQGLIRYEGEIRICGQSLESLSPLERSLKVTYLGRDLKPEFPFEVSAVLDQGFFGLDKTILNTSETETHWNHVVNQLKVNNLLHRDVSTLSAGEWGRVTLARTFLRKARVTCLDEALSALDLDGLGRALELMLEYRKQGSNFLIVSHDWNLLAECADEIIAMKDGCVLTQGLPSDILTEKILRELFPDELNLRFNLSSGPNPRIQFKNKL